ncbi:MAG TPA: metal-sensitive transcriptional regulator [Thermoanaerobaculia bacterium]|nr:metal-sensitive transcriptional regulator [Thermoanaerobaculia bacterium]
MTGHERRHAQCDHTGGSLGDRDRHALITRLGRIEGQVRGIARMIEEDRYCVDILNQISAVRESLRSAASVLLDSHIRSCVADAVASGDSRRAEVIYGELAEIFNRYSR